MVWVMSISYANLSETLEVGQKKKRSKFIRRLTDIQYQRNDLELKRGTFRVKGDVFDIYPANEETAFRVDFFDDEIERIRTFDALTGFLGESQSSLRIFPCSHYVTPAEKLKHAIKQIKLELKDRLAYFEERNQLLENQRLSQRVAYDLEMMRETGFVKGIENYSRYLTNREVGEQPATLLDYFPDDYLLLIDESHLTLPQVRGMYAGD